ncbi:polyphosphate kinase 1 [Faecalibacterium sp. An121]|uniref:polyphosphate kinase 1 n=1 Tax=Faecalibacterium sp. An121 TaxID=1965550 RepID=UPI000B37A94B|nr:polyphosphate kinase 1 [Faecalibacterium sp. An121]OUQ40258.1 polyphosphate kinase 1 [Faecalibacterium sp. An121]
MKEESIFINRELSWLDFNQRVLVLGKDKNVPLAEQLKFLAIYGSNLDEFFMVRVGSLQERANLKGKKEKPENKTNMTPEEQLNAIMPKTAELQMDCDKYYHKALEALAEHGYRKVNFDKLTKEEERFWKKYFQNELFPILSPQIVDNRHPFPFLRNKEIYLGVLLKDKKAEEMSLGIIPISSQMERLCFLKRDGETLFALTEEMVYHFVSMVFAKESIVEKCLFRVTRNADIDVKEGMMDHDIDYREIMTELLKRRRKLAAVRLQVTPAPAPEIIKMLCARLELNHRRVFEQKSPLDLSFFYKLDSRIENDGHAELFYSPARPMLPPLHYSLTSEVQKHDVLLYYPYQSIRPFILMLKKAARDPEVISIKMTLYRLARESQIVQALVDAAENGKEVVALVELRARFDEQNNIDWSKQLEEAGCTVVYGFEDYKVHSKLTLITRKNAEGYSYITQIGTGNYNEKTSELYTDLSFITADPDIGAEAAGVFQNLAVQKLTEETDQMLVAPLRFKSVLLDEIERVTEAARLGRPASMILKNNAISDRDIILKLEEASKAGARIDMIVRGICCVRAGVPGKTENLHIRSIVGRYLEHARIYSFFDGRETRIYIASGDFLTRNTECRVEVGVRIKDPVLVKKLTDILEMQLADNVNAREMTPDGSYQKVKRAPGEPIVNSQMGMYELLKDDWTGGHPVGAPAPQPRPAVEARPAPAAPAVQPAAQAAAQPQPAPAPVRPAPAVHEPAPMAQEPAAPAPAPKEEPKAVEERPVRGVLGRLRRLLRSWQ